MDISLMTNGQSEAINTGSQYWEWEEGGEGEEGRTDFAVFSGNSVSGSSNPCIHAQKSA